MLKYNLRRGAQSQQRHPWVPKLQQQPRHSRSLHIFPARQKRSTTCRLLESAWHWSWQEKWKHQTFTSLQERLLNSYPAELLPNYLGEAAAFPKKPGNPQVLVSPGWETYKALRCFFAVFSNSIVQVKEHSVWNKEIQVSKNILKIPRKQLF